MKVPWLPKPVIAQEADALRRAYERETGRSADPPVPVRDIIRSYLGLRLEPMDFEKRLGLRGVLGATWVNRRLVCMDQALMEHGPQGRADFTCAHELGHWMLHRRYVETAARSDALEEAIVCRSGDAKKPIEWQADCFASHLLLPEDPVREAVHGVCGTEVMVIENVRSAFGGTSLYVDPCAENWHVIADLVRSAGNFANVSKQAVIIRMQDLGLLVNRTDHPMGWVS